MGGDSYQVTLFASSLIVCLRSLGSLNDLERKKKHFSGEILTSGLAF